MALSPASSALVLQALHHDHSQYTTVYILSSMFQLCQDILHLWSHTNNVFSVCFCSQGWVLMLLLPPQKNPCVVWLITACSSSRRMVSALTFHDLSPLCAPSIHCSSQGLRSLTSCGEWLAFLLRFMVMHSTGAAEHLSLWRGIQILPS